MADGLTTIPRAAIADLIAGISGYKCYWDGDALDYDTTYVSLNVVGYHSIGIDEVREDYDAATDQILTTMCGNRAFSLSIRADSYEMEEPAYEILERIRRRLQGGAAAELLLQEGVSITTTTNPIHDLTVVADNRPVYASTWDVGMAFAVNEVDTQPMGGGKPAKGVTVHGTLSGGQAPVTLDADVKVP